MSIRIKNNDTIAHTWVGQTISPSQYYTIQSTEYVSWSSNSILLAAIASGTAVVNDGTSDYTDLSAAIDFLKGNTISAVITSQPSVTVSATPAFGSKTITVSGVTKKLYARNVGFQAPLTAGANIVDYTATFAWSKLLGAEVINSEALDTIDLKVYDTATGTYSGYPNALLNQFAYSVNLPKDYYIRMANFDADIYVGLIIRVTYTSVSAKTIGINLLFNEVKA